MAAQQLPDGVYKIGGQPIIAGYEVIEAVAGFEEDAEDKQKGDGRHNAKIIYSKRATWQLELEALTTGAPEVFVKGGGLDSSFEPVDNGAAVWKVVSADYGLTRGVQTCSLNVISLVDELEP